MVGVGSSTPVSQARLIRTANWTKFLYMKVNISFDDVDEYAIEEEKELKLKFSSGYIQWMTEYASFIEKTHVYLSGEAESSWN